MVKNKDEWSGLKDEWSGLEDEWSKLEDEWADLEDEWSKLEDEWSGLEDEWSGLKDERAEPAAVWQAMEIRESRSPRQSRFLPRPHRGAFRPPYAARFDRR